MRVYTIHLPPPYSGRDKEPEVIREGFNLWAFLFAFLWALFNRMWLVALVLLVGLAVLGGVMDVAGASETAKVIISLAVAVWIGASANDWRRAHLERKGWRTAAVIAAPDANAALRRYADLAAIGTSAPYPSALNPA